MIKAVIFDVGGVLINVADAEYYKYLDTISGYSTHYILDIVLGLTPLFEKGMITAGEFNRRLAKRLRIRPSQVQWTMALKKGRLDVDVMEIALMLHGEYTTAYLSNVDPLRYAYAKRMIDPGVFDYKFASYKLKMVKPEKRIYRYVLRQMKMEPDEVVFIDNDPRNVKSAQELGIHGITFVGRRKLDLELSKLNL